MKEFYFTVNDKNGLHARPAGMLAMMAKSFESDIKIYNGEKEADGKRLLSLMCLGAVCGTILHFKISGKDEDVAEKSLKEYCKEKLSGE